MKKYTLGSPTSIDNIISYSLPKNTQLPWLDNILFDYIDLHSSVNIKKNIDEFIESKLQTLSSSLVNPCVTIYQIKNEDTPFIKKLIKKTKILWLAGEYKDCNMDTHIVALKILTDSSAVLLCIDAEHEDIRADNLVGEPGRIHKFLKKNGILPIQGNWGFMDAREDTLLSALERLDEMNGSNFKSILEQQILDDDIVSQKKKLNKSIIKKKKDLKLSSKSSIYKV